MPAAADDVQQLVDQHGFAHASWPREEEAAVFLEKVGDALDAIFQLRLPHDVPLLLLKGPVLSPGVLVLLVVGHLCDGLLGLDVEHRTAVVKSVG